MRIFYLYLCIFVYSESSLYLIPQSFESFLSKTSFNGLPPELQQTIFEWVWNKPIDYFKIITMVHPSFNALVIKNELVPFEDNKYRFIYAFLKERDLAIKFKYHFYEDQDGTYHQQDYYKLPLSSKGRTAMKDIVLLIRYIACKLSKPVNEIADYYHCFQYIRFHEEFCFRAAVPETTSAWKGNYQVFIELTCLKYIKFFDENYIVNPEFRNDTEWLTQKIHTSNIRAITTITDPNKQICNRAKKKRAYDMAKKATRKNADKAGMGLELPNSLFNIILFYGNAITFGIPSKEPFKQYLEKLLKRNQNMPPQI
jgi:hypothetical protein